MNLEKPFKDKTLTETQWFLFLGFMGIVTRLPLLNLSKAETTDGILSLTYFSPYLVDTPRFVILPAYPFLLWLTGDHLMAGRFLAALAGLLFLIPLWKFARRWLSVEMTGLVCLMALFSPLLWQWSLKVMGDTLFLLFFWWSLERLSAAFTDKKDSSWWQANFAGALAALTRPEGFLLLPWIVTVNIRLTSKNRILHWLSLPSLWAVPFFFLGQRFFTLLYAYREGLGLTKGEGHVHFPLLNFVEHFFTYLTQPVYVFTPLVFLFAVLGLVKMIQRQDSEGESLKKVILQVYTLLFLSRLIPTTYQDRHLLPFLPLLLVAAGFHLETFFEWWGKSHTPMSAVFFKNGLLTLCIVWLTLFSAAVLIAQSESFSDIKRSSEFLKKLPADAVIYSDEVPKTQYWAEREIKPITMPFEPQKGDYFVLHSFYTPRLTFVDQNLSDRFGIVRLHQDRSMVVPLLTDIMEDPNLQNRVKSTAYRFDPQFFISLVYQVPK